MDPLPGDTVTSGDTITLYVSMGQKIELVTVPSFLGLTKEEAMKLLIEADLSLGKVTPVKSDQPVGTILSQSKPEFANVPKSATKIDFTVSGGPDYDPDQDNPKKDEEMETENTDA
ncbi:MAG: PASTA domain-containing protein [Clostridia bacterium]|nr:PASTA domain-containing protein [Clostridia bacterium]